MSTPNDPPTNADRAERARDTLQRYTDMYEGGDAEPAMRDLLCDMMHWCHQYEGGPTFESELATARQHFVEETT